MEHLGHGVSDVRRLPRPAQFGDERLAQLGVGGHHPELGSNDCTKTLAGGSGDGGGGGDRLGQCLEEIGEEKGL